MRTSVKVKTLIIISAVMIAVVFSFCLGYFKAKMDFREFSDTYTVSVEKNAESTVSYEENTEPTTPIKETAQPTVSPEETAEQDDLTLLVNINTASAAELDKLPGIGSALAGRIVEYRKENGEFRNRYDIMDVPGIGAGTYEKIKNNIYVNE